MEVIKGWKKTFYHGFCQTLVLLNRTLFSGQLFKAMRRKPNWHIVRLKRKEELKKKQKQKTTSMMIKSSIYTFLEFCFNMAIVKYISYSNTENTWKFSQISGLSPKQGAEKHTHTTETHDLNRKPFSFSFIYFRAGTSCLLISLKITTCQCISNFNMFLFDIIFLNLWIINCKQAYQA